MAQSKKKKKASSEYEAELRALQIALVGLQKQVREAGRKVLVIFEGRDAAGKDGAIQRITEHLPSREVKVVALPAPSDRERKAWYFQRYVAEIPVAGEMALFNRSWYNRAGVEPVMGFCSEEEHQLFLRTVPTFESLLVESGVQIIKYYLDISRKEQRKRLKQRAADPLNQWKIGPLDTKALRMWDAYTEARDEMLLRTHTGVSPWTIVHADEKHAARLNVIADLIARVSGEPPADLMRPNPAILSRFDEAALTDGRLSR
jgi:polyphosphate kinase 2